MKFNIKSVLSFGLFFASFNSFAATNAEIVKSLYSDGTAPATAEDFPERNFGTGKYVSPPNNLCVVVDSTDQPFKYDISRTIRFTPAGGPLVPEKREEKFVFGNSTKSYNLFVDPVVDGTDLTVTNPIYSSWVSGTDGVSHSIPAKLFARKSGQFIAFKVVVDRSSQKVRDGSFYGYCYPANGLSLF